MKKFLKFLVITVILFLAFLSYLVISARIADPDIDLKELQKLEISSNDGILYFTKGGWFQKNNEGLYEIYVEGEAKELGYKRGLLSQELIKIQEDLFVKKIEKLVPSRTYLRFLKEIVTWFNRNLPEYIQPEYIEEIYGISRFASDDFDFIGSKYQRILNYHAAHDIGHALQNYNLVGCSSFSSWEPDGSNLLVARNFDFSLGEEFAANNVVCFYAPLNGIPFAMISWSDFIGTVSGMNLEGLTVTINAGENDIPTGIGTPISLIAREILQYAGDIETAFKIAQKRKSFVSESFLIGSASDRKTAIIEKTPDTTILILPSSNQIICANHFLSKPLQHTVNPDIQTASRYRFETLQSILESKDSLSPTEMVEVLRMKEGLDGADIGLGNEKSLNQLIAHHGIVFDPIHKKFWISTPPYQLGKFLCYNLDSVFSKHTNLESGTTIFNEKETIPEDAFLNSQSYKNFRRWQEMKNEIENIITNGEDISEEFEKEFISLNSEYYYTYELLANLCAEIGQQKKAKGYYNLALKKELSNPADLYRIQSAISELEE